MPKLSIRASCYATARKPIKDRVDQLASKKLSTRLGLFEGLMKARELVDQAPERKLSIADLAHAAGIAEAHFSRCFRESFGLPPYQYILERRLAKARDLLSRTDLTVTEIASICGFESLSTFINIFTREHRQSPSSFRSRKLAGSDKRRTARSGNVEETTEQLNGTET